MPRLKTARSRLPVLSNTSTMQTPRVRWASARIQARRGRRELVIAGEATSRVAGGSLGSATEVFGHALQYPGVHHSQNQREEQAAHHEWGAAQYEALNPCPPDSSDIYDVNRPRCPSNPPIQICNLPLETTPRASRRSSHNHRDSYLLCDCLSER